MVCAAVRVFLPHNTLQILNKTKLYNTTMCSNGDFFNTMWTQQAYSSNLLGLTTVLPERVTYAFVSFCTALLVFEDIDFFS